MKKEFSGNLITIDLRETYHEKGEYSFKIVLNPSLFKNSLDCCLNMVDANGNAIKHDVKKWGRKVICTFNIDDKTANGISAAYVDLKDKDQKTYKELLKFWVIK